MFRFNKTKKLIAFLIASLFVTVGIPTNTAHAAKSRISIFSPCTNNRTKQIEIYQGTIENCNISFTIIGADKAFSTVKIGWYDDEGGDMYWEQSAKSNKLGKGVVKDSFRDWMGDNGECYSSEPFDYRIQVQAKGKMKAITLKFSVLLITNENNCYGYDE